MGAELQTVRKPPPKRRSEVAVSACADALAHRPIFTDNVSNSPQPSRQKPYSRVEVPVWRILLRGPALTWSRSLTVGSPLCTCFWMLRRRDEDWVTSRLMAALYRRTRQDSVSRPNSVVAGRFVRTISSRGRWQDSQPKPERVLIVTFPPLEPSPTLPDPGPVPPISNPSEMPPPDEDFPVPDPDNPNENPDEGPDLPPSRSPFPDHEPDPPVLPGEG